ncbi:MAG: type I-F CRISPR-associated protein Csy1 [Oceanospirillaceae bacterium]|uniref:type I-F CRISPR-associated protein Csy1 n=1 Tax=unclassified Thalassolituus TaxID=2624967 RepID=UPI000C4758E9|nr:MULTISPECIES: type I-F CRISPR-associated protein Csy1 [unclassified Thalassolituus]MAS24260.1 type I-F CRISPR-associated protein Csy1 [Oceanospirillaceae bacterium]MAX99721.1 type I-F CRISPR-associated protein Csy1 [Oceanospirillaceae bacterium]MBL35318.1 type I-F CRISPR-associated protein Csy1 [Oceanospirillaceae bacterium]MBS53553.1 type I-F CRISPR-associated protein Csy1 [Oceanospirillaceae bacterium]|tara:strand:- start:448 stop:1770 length:1323 start_codon:yes stop_codon:yes gene_type:complete
MELTEKIRQYIEDRCTAKLEPLEKELAKAEKEKTADEFAEFRLDWHQRKQELLDKFKPATWLSDAASRAKQISLVSHALKYTHSDAKGTSLLADITVWAAGRVLSSADLTAMKADVVGNAAALDVANLLLLEHEGVRLLDQVAANDTSALAEFGTADQQAEWQAGFKEALKVKEPSSHTLAKQLYFPVADEETGYHLLAPLAASSFNHAVFQRVQHSRFSEHAKEARDARRKGHFWQVGTRDYLNLAIQTFGGTKPQNISLLNSQRGGRAYLFNAQPPVWKSRSKPPKSVDAFWSGYRWRIRKQLDELTGFLEWANQHELNNRHIRNKRGEMVAAMVDELHQYAAQLRLFPAGWAAEPMGNGPEACWVDPARDDKDFQYEREGKAWCKQLALNFGRVLAKSIDQKGKRAKLSMSDAETAHFKQQIQRQAYLLMVDLEELV